MTFLESVLGIALLISLVAVVALARYTQLEHRQRLKKATDAFRLGGSQKVGDISQLLGTFDILAKYDEVALLSSTSAQSSMDLLGRKGNQLDFIELKKAGTQLTRPERILKTYIDSGQLKISYKIIDVSWPTDIRITDRV